MIFASADYSYCAFVNIVGSLRIKLMYLDFVYFNTSTCNQ